MSLLRTFIALDIPPDIQQAIGEAASTLRHEIGPLVKWVPVDNLHLTLKFLGDVSTTRAEELSHMLRSETNSCNPFEMHIGGLGSFPSPRRPRVIFIGIQAPAGLEALSRAVESACARLGFKPDKRGFSPHLTIGRVRQYPSPDDGRKIRCALESSTIDSLGTARVDSVQVYKSDLKSDGAVYTKLFSTLLK